MDKISWIKDLVNAEISMEESGVIDISSTPNKKQILKDESIYFLNRIKIEMIDVIDAFNELRNSSAGQLKVYDIAKTQADFMLFRNGYKLIFSLKESGQIGVKFQFVHNNFIPMSNNIEHSQNADISEDILEASWGAFDAITWHYKGLDIKIEKLVHYYMSRFLTESAQ